MEQTVWLQRDYPWMVVATVLVRHCAIPVSARDLASGVPPRCDGFANFLPPQRPRNGIVRDESATEVTHWGRSS